MTQFHRDQEVEVLGDIYQSSGRFYAGWRKAKILFATVTDIPGYWVEFPNGLLAEIDAEHIRLAPGLEIFPHITEGPNQ